MSYLTITECGQSPSGKTQVWIVRGARSRLGDIRWFGRWRQYAFYPDAGTLYNPECLAEIGAFCLAATQEHRRQREAVKAVSDGE